MGERQEEKERTFAHFLSLTLYSKDEGRKRERKKREKERRNERMNGRTEKRKHK